MTALGFLGGLRWALIRFASHNRILRSEASVHPKTMKSRISVRTNRSSDASVFDQIFVEKDLSFLPRVSGPVRVILDLGANIGCTSALFLSRFPEAFVLAVEPDPETARMCRKNLAPFGTDRSKVVCGAVWSSTCNLVLARDEFGDHREWACKVRPAAAGEKADVSAYSISDLLKMCPANKIDLLKVDIEGSEKELFAVQTESWLPLVRNLCIEIHGKECERVVFAALGDYKFERMNSGEKVVLLDINTSSAV